MEELLRLLLLAAGIILAAPAPTAVDPLPVHLPNREAPQVVVHHPPSPRSNSQARLVQFHSQDGTGQYSFGYSYPGQGHVQSRGQDGRVQGAYSYTNPSGKVVRVHYRADENGYRAVGQDIPVPSAVGLPRPVQDLPHVAAARRQHLADFRDIAGRIQQLHLRRQSLEATTEDPHKDERYPKLNYSAYQQPNPDQIEDKDLDSVRVESSGLNQDQVLSYGVAEERQPYSFYYSLYHGLPEVHQAIYPKTEHPLSLKAAYHGAVPPAAVHDVQVSPSQKEQGNVPDPHQLLPVYLEPAPTYVRVHPSAKVSLPESPFLSHVLFQPYQKEGLYFR